MRNIFTFSILFIIFISCSSSDIQQSTLKDNKYIEDLILDASIRIIDNKPCPDDMVYIKKYKFCIDRFEWPNKKDIYPDFAMTAYEAENLCQSVKKRLCTHTEWIRACVGSNNMSYGYSDHYINNICNDSVNSNYIPVDWSKMDLGANIWKAYARTLYKGNKSGSRILCFSYEDDDKVYDMIGNVREWVKDPYGNGGYSFESSFWYGTLSGPLGCGFVVRNHSPKFASYEVGTRCCL